MTIKTVNFESLMKNFKYFYDSRIKLEELQKVYITQMDVYKKEMETLYKTSTSLVLDDATQKMNQHRFMELQKEASKAQQDFSKMINEKQTEEMTYCYGKLTDVVTKYAKANEINMVVSNTSVIYSDTELDITSAVTQEFKNLNLFVDEPVEELIEEDSAI